MSSSGLSALDGITYTKYRRPTTIDTNVFWYTAYPAWKALLNTLNSPEKRKKKTARNTLNKFSAAGLIMETSDGKAAPNHCARCEPAGVPCRVRANKPDTVCAYCKRLGKSGCEADKVVESESLTPTDEPASDSTTAITRLEEKNASLKDEVAGLKTRIETLEGWFSRQERINYTIADENMSKGNNIKILWDKVFGPAIGEGDAMEQ